MGYISEPQVRSNLGVGDVALDVERGLLASAQFEASLYTIISGHDLHFKPPTTERATGSIQS